MFIHRCRGNLWLIILFTRTCAVSTTTVGLSYLRLWRSPDQRRRLSFAMAERDNTCTWISGLHVEREQVLNQL